jgi:RimJ/RimL family protein N-acetyltransferase
VEALETERLRLEPWAPEHGGLIARLSALPEVMRFIGTGETWPAARAEESHARALVHWRTHGFGWRLARTREGGEVVGLIALNLAGDGLEGIAPDDHEIGWWMDPAFQGRGYATEGARALQAQAFDVLGARRLVARVAVANAASIAVARRLGLEPAGEFRGRFGEPTVVLAQTAEQFRG